MNQDRIESQWDQLKGRVREQWSRLTDDDVGEIHGKRERLLGKLQEKYGESRDKAEEMIRDFERKI